MVTVTTPDHHILGGYRFIAHATNARLHHLNYHLIKMSSGKTTSHTLPHNEEKKIDALDVFLLQEELLQLEFLKEFPAREDLTYLPEAVDSMLLQIMAVTPYPVIQQKIKEVHASRNQIYHVILIACETLIPSGFLHRGTKDKLFAHFYEKIQNKYLSTLQ